MDRRLPLVDALKAGASQLIVLHHLAVFGPMADTVRPWAPATVDAIADHGRLAVQVFLVVAGFLAGRALLAPGSPAALAPLAAIARRWRRLAGPYVVALALALAAAALGRLLAEHDSVPAAPTPRQLLANLAMLQDIVGEEALSAGIWYVAIDLQLYTIAVAIAWLAARRGGRASGAALVGAAAAASLLVFNRDASLDAWGIYFLGSYGLGLLASLADRGPRGAAAIVAIAALGTAALALDFRPRIAVALATALLLAWAVPRGAFAARLDSPRIGWLGRISYAVFLVHFPVIVLFDAAAVRWFADEPLACAAGIALAFVASTVAGAAFHRRVEVPLSGPRKRSVPLERPSDGAAPVPASPPGATRAAPAGPDDPDPAPAAR